MDLLFLGARARLDRWRGRPDMAGPGQGPGPRDTRHEHAREAGQEPPGPPVPDGPHARAAAAVLRYDVFPAHIGEGVVARAPLQVGDVVGLRYHFVPGLDLFFASRVTAVFDEVRDGVHHTGFTYRTLAGHPEIGEETFSTEKDLATGRVLVALRAWSREGSLLARLFRPLARTLQVRAGKAGADRLLAIARG